MCRNEILQRSHASILATILIARDFFRRIHPVIRVFLGVNATSGCSTLRTLVNLSSRRVFYSHVHILLNGFDNDTTNYRIGIRPAILPNGVILPHASI